MTSEARGPARERDADDGWLLELRRAADGSAQRGVETLRGAAPTLANADNAGALTGLVLCAFVAAAALFRTRVAPLPLDLIASALRTFAFACGVRALIGVGRALAQLRGDLRAGDASLALSEHGLRLRSVSAELAARRDEVLGSAAPEGLPSRALAPRPLPLLVVLAPRAGAPRFLTIPPYFAASAAILQARLTRWLERTPGPAAEPLRSPPPDPEQRYTRAAHGQLEPGMLVVPEGRGYLLRAPYSALLGLLFALDLLWSAGPMRRTLLMPVLAAGALALGALAAWFVWLQRRRAARLGIGMLLTPEELLVRGRAGVVSVPWQQLTDIAVQTSARWSPFVGTYAARVLTLGTQEGQRLLFDASFLGVPAEVVAVACQAYRAGIHHG